MKFVLIISKQSHVNEQLMSTWNVSSSFYLSDYYVLLLFVLLTTEGLEWNLQRAKPVCSSKTMKTDSKSYSRIRILHSSGKWRLNSAASGHCFDTSLLTCDNFPNCELSRSKEIHVENVKNTIDMLNETSGTFQKDPRLTADIRLSFSGFSFNVDMHVDTTH